MTFTGFANGPQSYGVAGGTLSYDGETIVQAVGNGSGAIPFPTTEGDYLSIKKGGEATFAFTQPKGSFGFMWGSIDGYNTIAFSLSGAPVGTFTGSDIINPANGNQHAGGSAYVTFGGAFDEVVLTSSGNSFEIDNISVPDGGATLGLFGLALLGLQGARRLASKKNA